MDNVSNIGNMQKFNDKRFVSPQKKLNKHTAT